MWEILLISLKDYFVILILKEATCKQVISLLRPNAMNAGNVISRIPCQQLPIEVTQPIFLADFNMLILDKVVMPTLHHQQIFVNRTDDSSFVLSNPKSIVSLLPPSHFSQLYLNQMVTEGLIMLRLGLFTVGLICRINLLTEITSTIRQVNLILTSPTVKQNLFDVGVQLDKRLHF